MKTARQHLRVLKKQEFLHDPEIFMPLTRQQMTRYHQEQKTARRDWNNRKARGLCMDSDHYEFMAIGGEGGFCNVCGRRKGL